MSANTYLTPEERAVLESARVGIAGVGGLGSNCAMHLVRAGVKHLTVVDFDVVNESNLNRQFFFRDQLGRKKVEALKDNLLRIDPDADIRAVDAKLDAVSVKEIFGDCDIVVEAFDVVDAKVMLVSSFASSGKKLVTASGLAGWGRSNEMRVKKMGNIVAIGDGETAVGANAAPASPRVGIAAAMQANSVVALLLGKEL
ncbi:MAG: sulfur carrier protein ThiS adenylyltransferase ThiF [Kiritimatiellae bacterium]|nr:sulfur carrier protein ThiS adenylyltransferase ThiF [Kiritimatiellia bacterium]